MCLLTWYVCIPLFIHVRVYDAGGDVVIAHRAQPVYIPRVVPIGEQRRIKRQFIKLIRWYMYECAHTCRCITYMYICVYILIYIYICMYTYTSIYIYIYAYLYMYIYICICIYMNIYIYVYIYIYIYLHVGMHVHTYICVNMHIQIVHFLRVVLTSRAFHVSSSNRLILLANFPY